MTTNGGIDRRTALGWMGALPCGAFASTGASEPPAIAGRGYRLVKNWDFAATVTDEATLRQEFFTRYIFDNGRLDFLNDEWQRYRDNDNHRFEDGALSLVAHVRGALAPGGIQSGMLRSRWTGQYGYFECRMKVPAGRGMWPAFWLNPQDAKWPPEIDVVEIVDDGRIGTRQSFHYVHGREAKKAIVNSSRLDKNKAWRPGFDYADDFHRFAVDWTPEGVRHYVDDVLVVDRSFAWRHDDGTDAGPVHVLVNLAVGGKWPGPPSDAGVFPARLRLAHMRVWQPAG
jgi:beta-glucanase (GH16 family)